MAPAASITSFASLSPTAEKTQLLLLSGSVDNPEDIVAWLTRLGRDTHLVTTADRPVPLDHISSDDMPYSAPKNITGYWPRIAVDTLVSEYGPLPYLRPTPYRR